MRPLSIAIFSCLFLLSQAAQSAGDSCKKVSELAHDAMKARQAGDLLQDSIESVGDGSDFAQKVIMMAYEKPISQEAKGKEEAVKEFQNEAYRVCFNATKN